MNFLDIKTDFAFKKVFGSEDSKDILINFLNAVIIFNHDQHIKSLTIVDPYNIPMLKGMKDTYVDVKAVLDEELEKAFDIANEANFSEQELELQHRKKDWVYMQKSSLGLASGWC